MTNFLAAKYGCNSIRGFKDISIHVRFRHFSFWSVKCTTVQKQYMGTYKILFPHQ